MERKKTTMLGLIEMMMAQRAITLPGRTMMFFFAKKSRSWPHAIPRGGKKNTTCWLLMMG
jgi:hypothetical protein